MPDNIKEEVKKTNLLEKIALTRFELSQSSLKKTGLNKDSNYRYFELGDFLPTLVMLMNKNGLITMFDLNADMATLRIINTDYLDESWNFNIPVAEAKVPDGSDIQNLGAKITYLRRYLFMVAFEIAEDSVVEVEKNAIGLSDEDAKSIKNAKTHEELNILCKEMASTKDPEYKKAILAEYNKRKLEIGGQNDNS